MLPQGNDLIPVLGSVAGLGLPTARVMVWVGVGSWQVPGCGTASSPSAPGSTTGVNQAVMLLQGTPVGPFQ